VKILASSFTSLSLFFATPGVKQFIERKKAVEYRALKPDITAAKKHGGQDDTIVPMTGNKTDVKRN
jgi:hypothetical protein